MKPGELITYSYTVTNRGGTDLGGLELSTQVPDHTHVAASTITGGGGCGNGGCNAGNEILWTLGTLAAGQSRTVAMAALVDSGFTTPAPADGTVILDSARVLNSGGTVAVAERSVMVDSTPVLMLGMTENREPVEPGGLLTYRCCLAIAAR